MIAVSGNRSRIRQTAKYNFLICSGDRQENRTDSEQSENKNEGTDNEKKKQMGKKEL